MDISMVCAINCPMPISSHYFFAGWGGEVPPTSQMGDMARLASLGFASFARHVCLGMKVAPCLSALETALEQRTAQASGHTWTHIKAENSFLQIYKYKICTRQNNNCGGSPTGSTIFSTQ